MSLSAWRYVAHASWSTGASGFCVQSEFSNKTSLLALILLASPLLSCSGTTNSFVALSSFHPLFTFSATRTRVSGSTVSWVIVLLWAFAKHEVWQIKGQITKPGEGYHVWHCEAMDMQSSVRLLSYILYLNDIDEGGETEFLYYKKRIKPKAGTLLVFPAYFTHTHRGNTNLSDKDKVILTGWYTFC